METRQRIRTGETAGVKRTSLSSLGESRTAFFLILPSFVGFFTFFIFPAIRGLYLSFTDWDLFTEPNWIGVQNYVKIFQDPEFWNAMKVTLLYVVYNIPIQTALGLGIAVALIQLKKSSVALRSLIILPWLLPNVIVGLLWLWLLDPTLGIVNEGVRALGFDRIPFLSTSKYALGSIAGINIWRHMGYTSLILFAGLQDIPKSIYEAAEIDGAGTWKSFLHITLPLIRPVMTFVVITSVIGSFQLFDTVAVTTEGGPTHSTEVIIWYIYKHAFSRFNMGYGSAVSFVLFVVLFLFTLAYTKKSNANESDLGG